MSATAWSVAHTAPGGATRARSTVLRSSCGRVITLDTHRWWAAPPPEEERLLARVAGPALDIGCGPGRHCVDLARRGVDALGVDSSSAAVAAARARGAAVVQRSVFDRLPSEGAWASALLLDGNVGIGGDPVRLLRRVRVLLRPGGRIFLELEGPGVPSESLHVRAEVPSGATEWFPWARLGIDDLDGVARTAGSRVAARWVDGGRWFARLETR